MENPYRSLLSPEIYPIGESKGNYCAITERHVQIMWFEQKYFKPLMTSEGQAVTVISPGIWNAEAGPDFKKAHLSIGEREYRGDIEVHLSNSSWCQHKHHTDPRYSNVILHLSLWEPKNRAALATCENRNIHQAYLEPSLTISLNRIMKLIDIELYPYFHHTGTGRCAGELFNEIPEKEVQFFFKSAAEWRLRKKAERMLHEGHDPNESFLLGISAALGYKSNVRAFIEMFRRLSLAHKLSEKQLFSQALGMCGFFSDKFQKKWISNPYYGELHEIHLAEPMFSENNILLNLHQIRPFNHPIRRISYLTKLISDINKQKLLEGASNIWATHWREASGEKGIRELEQRLLGLVPEYQDAYLNRHYTFSLKPSNIHLPLVGQQFFENVLVNCFFPLIYHEMRERNDPQEWGTFWKLYSNLSSAESGKNKYLKKRFFGNSRKGDLLNTTIFEQGAYQLHHDFCMKFETSCEGCPFVSRYKQYYPYYFNL